MILTSNPSRSSSENKVCLQKCIIQLALCQKEGLSHILFSTRKWLNIKDTRPRPHLAFIQWKNIYPVQSVVGGCARQKDTTMPRPWPCPQDIPRELLTPPAVPPTLWLWNYWPSPFQGADPSLPDISPLCVLFRHFLCPSKSVSNLTPLP